MAAAEPDNFFKQKRTTSEIKDKILPAYFQTWLNMHVREPENQLPASLLFVDANSGEGYSEPEKPTAPVLILNQIYLQAAQLVKAIFINPTTTLADKLNDNLAQLPFYTELPAAPAVLTETTFQAQSDLLEDHKQPALLFLDINRPAVTRQLLLAALQQVATDVLLIANFKKLQQTLLAPEPGDWEKTFWGDQLSAVYGIVQQEPNTKKQEVRFMQVLEQLFTAANCYFFKFMVKAPGKNAVTQYLLLLTKSLPNYLSIKEIMQPYSDCQEDGVPLFRVTNQPPMPLLPGFFRYLSNYSLDKLVNDLAKSRSRFHYQTLQHIYEEHSVGTNYIKTNYQQALEKLRDAGILYPVDARNKKVKAITDTSVIFYNLHRSNSK